MSAFESSTPTRSRRTALLLSIVVIGLLAGAWYVWPRFEREPPEIRLSPDADVLGPAPMEIVVSDRGAGLKSVAATLSSGGTELSLTAEEYARPVAEQKMTIAALKLKGLKEGPAVLRVSARDYSWWRWFNGNETVIQKNLTIDVTPPVVELVADDRYVNFGGVGMIVYRASADTETSGVRIGNHYFPGYQGQIKNHPDHFIAFFAHPYNVPADVRAALVATDKAGNTRETRLVYQLKNVRYRKSTIAVSDSFIQNTVAPLLNDVTARQGSAKEIFIRVNRGLRKDNDDQIAAITKKGASSVLWKGAFRQLSNSKVEANFADARTYTYNKEVIDNAYHLGYDLSVTRHYPVEAANSGAVSFAGDLGIYGNTVILDHGLGLFTLYSHLSSIAVKTGDPVKQRQIIGKTGETGLASGDHLHFAVYLHGVAVLPVEWWDQKWINDNILPKLEGRSGKAIAEAQASPAPRKATRGKRR
ncbi:MAG TPA: M23 family metallopeptidase [Burkholderiales bacterium]|jgi:murein DD-endopeptidase MepM/ murein hydrolase activator NlpD|nr:M23 family metallopeptidase [Burkholderiales bacterium]